DEKLRGDDTKYSIPLFCTIDGIQRTIVLDSGDAPLIITVDVNATFEIEDDYGELFGVWSVPQHTSNSAMREFIELSEK
ncbi:hypothetical protein PMAYCL1PPCAC_32187, partial [Pristionchus mayeri]